MTVIVTIVITGLAALGAADAVISRDYGDWATIGDVGRYIARRAGIRRRAFYCERRSGDSHPYRYANDASYLYDHAYLAPGGDWHVMVRTRPCVRL